MVEPDTRLTRTGGKWQIATRTGNDRVFLTLGRCSCQRIAVRVWLACQGQGKR